MAEAMFGIMDRSDRVSRAPRGARVAAATRQFMEARGLGIGELAFAAQVDKRDLRRLLNDESCGHRLEDDLAAYFGWDFTEHVMSAVHGADPLTARESELARQLAEAAALQARIERERAVRAGPAAHLALVAGRRHVSDAQAAGERRALAPAAPVPD